MKGFGPQKFLLFNGPMFPLRKLQFRSRTGNRGLHGAGARGVRGHSLCALHPPPYLPNSPRRKGRRGYRARADCWTQHDFSNSTLHPPPGGRDQPGFRRIVPTGRHKIGHSKNIKQTGNAASGKAEGSQVRIIIVFSWCREGESNPHSPFGPADFKSAASANFAIPAPVHSSVGHGAGRLS